MVLMDTPNAMRMHTALGEPEARHGDEQAPLSEE